MKTELCSSEYLNTKNFKTWGLFLQIVSPYLLLVGCLDYALFLVGFGHYLEDIHLKGFFFA